MTMAQTLYTLFYKMSIGEGSTVRLASIMAGVLYVILLTPEVTSFNQKLSKYCQNVVMQPGGTQISPLGGTGGHEMGLFKLSSQPFLTACERTVKLAIFTGHIWLHDVPSVLIQRMLAITNPGQSISWQ